MRSDEAGLSTTAQEPTDSDTDPASSTFSYETLRPSASCAEFLPPAGLVASVVAGPGAVFIGFALAQDLCT